MIIKMINSKVVVAKDARMMKVGIKGNLSERKGQIWERVCKLHLPNVNGKPITMAGRADFLKCLWTRESWSAARSWSKSSQLVSSRWRDVSRYKLYTWANGVLIWLRVGVPRPVWSRRREGWLKRVSLAGTRDPEKGNIGQRERGLLEWRK